MSRHNVVFRQTASESRKGSERKRKKEGGSDRERLERAAGWTKVSEGSRVAAAGTPSHSAPAERLRVAAFL